jgi:hypothetical protein
LYDDLFPSRQLSPAPAAHLPADLQLRWRKIIESMGQKWSETDSPIAEPYRVTR